MANSPAQDELHFLDYWRVIVARKEIVLAVALLVILAGVLVTYSLPKVYMASCIVQVQDDKPDVPVFSREIWRYDPLFLKTQFELIQSAPVVEEVIRRLGLTEKLGRAYGYLDRMGEGAFDQTFKILAGSLKVQQFRDTNLIEIRIYMDEPKGRAPQMAADIATEIAEVYRDRSIERSRRQTERALKALLVSVEEQRERVREAEGRIADIRNRFELTLVSSAAGTDSALNKMTMTQLEQSRVQLRLELEAKRARFETMHALSPQDLRAAAPYMAVDPSIVKLLAEKRNAEVELTRMLGALGDNHPDVIQVRTTVEELDRKIEEALTGLKTGVLAEFEAVKAQMGAMDEMLDTIKASDRVAESEGYSRYEEAKAELDHAREVLSALEMRYAQENIELRIPRTTVEVVQPARVPGVNDPVQPKPLLNIIISVLVGIGAGTGLAFFVEYLDTSVKTIEDIEQSLDVKVVGVIPQKVKPLNDPAAVPAHAEAYRVMRTNLRLPEKAQGGRSLCVTSGSVGEGKSLTVFNLACVSAEQGDRVVIVDSDLHRPRQHKIAAIDNLPGLANVLVGEVELDEAIHADIVPNLAMLPSGRLKGGVHGLIASQRMHEVVTELLGRYDLVIFDSPPIIGVSDASLLVREVDGVILVIQHRKYPRAVSARARDMIINGGATLLGVTLNNINVSRDYAYYYYQQHYHYYPDGGRKRRGETT